MFYYNVLIIKLSEILKIAKYLTIKLRAKYYQNNVLISKSRSYDFIIVVYLKDGFRFR